MDKNRLTISITKKIVARSLYLALSVSLGFMGTDCFQLNLGRLVQAQEIEKKSGVVQVKPSRDQLVEQMLNQLKQEAPSATKQPLSIEKKVPSLQTTPHANKKSETNIQTRYVKWDIAMKDFAYDAWAGDLFGLAAVERRIYRLSNSSKSKTSRCDELNVKPSKICFLQYRDQGYLLLNDTKANRIVILNTKSLKAIHELTIPGGPIREFRASKNQDDPYFYFTQIENNRITLKSCSIEDVKSIHELPLSPQSFEISVDGLSLYQTGINFEVQAYRIQKGQVGETPVGTAKPKQKSLVVPGPAGLTVAVGQKLMTANLDTELSSFSGQVLAFSVDRDWYVSFDRHLVLGSTQLDHLQAILPLQISTENVNFQLKPAILSPLSKLDGSHYFFDDQRKQLIIAHPQTGVSIPLENTAMPDAPYLWAEIPRYAQATVGEELRVPIKLLNKSVRVDPFLRYAGTRLKGLKISETEIRWRPTEKQIGIKNIMLDLRIGKVAKRRSIYCSVNRPSFSWIEPEEMEHISHTAIFAMRKGRSLIYSIGRRGNQDFIRLDVIDPTTQKMVCHREFSNDPPKELYLGTEALFFYEPQNQKIIRLEIADLFETATYSHPPTFPIGNQPLKVTSLRVVSDRWLTLLFADSVHTGHSRPQYNQLESHWAIRLDAKSLKPIAVLPDRPQYPRDVRQDEKIAREGWMTYTLTQMLGPHRSNGHSKTEWFHDGVAYDWTMENPLLLIQPRGFLRGVVRDTGHRDFSRWIDKQRVQQRLLKNKITQREVQKKLTSGRGRNYFLDKRRELSLASTFINVESKMPRRYWESVNLISHQTRSKGRQTVLVGVFPSRDARKLNPFSFNLINGRAVVQFSEQIYNIDLPPGFHSQFSDTRSTVKPVWKQSAFVVQHNESVKLTYQASGGKPPYQVSVPASKEFVKTNAGNSATIEIDGPKLVDHLLYLIPFSQFSLLASAEHLQDYHVRVSDKYERLTGKPLKGIPIFIPLLVHISDKSKQGSILLNGIFLDVPAKVLLRKYQEEIERQQNQVEHQRRHNQRSRERQLQRQENNQKKAEQAMEEQKRKQLRKAEQDRLLSYIFIMIASSPLLLLVRFISLRGSLALDSFLSLPATATQDFLFDWENQENQADPEKHPHNEEKNQVRFSACFASSACAIVLELVTIGCIAAIWVANDKQLIPDRASDIVTMVAMTALAIVIWQTIFNRLFIGKGFVRSFMIAVFTLLLSITIAVPGTYLGLQLIELIKQ